MEEKNKKPDKTFCLRIPDKYYDKLVKKAKEEDRSLNSYICQLIKKDVGTDE